MKKKILMLTLICISLFSVTGCGKENKNEQKIDSSGKIKLETSESEKYEVFTELSVSELNDAIWEKNSFFHFIYDGSEKSKLLKDELEKLGHKYQWNIYITDFEKFSKEQLETEENKEKIQEEKKLFQDTYCEYIKIDETNVSNYDVDMFETDSEGNTIVYECSLAVAKRKNPSLDIKNQPEPSYLCNVCNDIESNALSQLKTEHSTNLIFYEEGVPAGNLDGYLPDDYVRLSKADQKDLIETSNNNLENWFKNIIDNI